jgi:hypothetical protein
MRLPHAAFVGIVFAGLGLAQLTLSGLVVDPRGRPVQGAVVDHPGDRVRRVTTDSQGRFTVTIPFSGIVVWKAGYRSYFLRPTSRDTEVRAILEPVRETPALCQLTSLPPFEIVKSRDSDYTATHWGVATSQGKKWITCGEGPNWSSGRPVGALVWDSVEYSEVVLGFDGLEFTDARGKTKAGRYWRYRGQFGGSCSYHDADEETARKLDCLMERETGR